MKLARDSCSLLFAGRLDPLAGGCLVLGAFRHIAKGAERRDELARARPPGDSTSVQVEDIALLRPPPDPVFPRASIVHVGQHLGEHGRVLR